MMELSLESLIATAKHYLFSADIKVWRQHVRLFRYFPVVCCLQPLLTTPAGKTSIVSKLNVPGRISWITMELASPVSFLLAFYLNPDAKFSAIPPRHFLIAGLYLIHYANRALISPLRAPNLSPSHILVWFAGVYFNYLNGYSLGGYFLCNFGHVNTSIPVMALGVLIWAIGLVGNVWHEDILYEIRRRHNRETAQGKKGDEQSGRLTTTNPKTGQVYEVPEGGLYEYCWHPHYFMEWIEWTGMVIACGGRNCEPMLNFLVNEVCCMMPRTYQGLMWYKEKFGEKLPQRKMAIPFVI